MLDENWTKLTNKDVDVPAFLRNIDRMKTGGTMSCPFCGGTVRMGPAEDRKQQTNMTLWE